MVDNKRPPELTRTARNIVFSLATAHLGFVEMDNDLGHRSISTIEFTFYTLAWLACGTSLRTFGGGLEEV